MKYGNLYRFLVVSNIRERLVSLLGKAILQIVQGSIYYLTTKTAGGGIDLTGATKKSSLPAVLDISHLSRPTVGELAKMLLAL
jgi:hypothetical protein